MDLSPIVLDQHSFVPPYKQIRSQLLALITAGRLSPGTELPSVRQLARDLGVAPNTVVRAYAELRAGGWVTMTLRRGVTVAELPLTLSANERLAELDTAVEQFIGAVVHLGLDSAAIHEAIDRYLRATPSAEQSA